MTPEEEIRQAMADVEAAKRRIKAAQNKLVLEGCDTRERLFVDPSVAKFSRELSTLDKDADRLHYAVAILTLAKQCGVKL